MLRPSWRLRGRGGFKLTKIVAQRRALLTLAIESSADDTAVAIVETQTADKSKPKAHIHFHEKVTANNHEFKGIHPRTSAISHQTELPGLIWKALRRLPRAEQDDKDALSFTGCEWPLRKPTFISVTRGPGMRAGLSTGLDAAKGLCLAFDIPFVGVHHMQAHALTPRLVSALSVTSDNTVTPDFPFRSLLVSGGHSLLVNSRSLVDFEEEIAALDIAAGDCIDKMAKHILPASMLDEHRTDTNYGAVLESFAFPNGGADYNYTPPKNREELLTPRPTGYRWAVPPPLKNSAEKDFAFSGLDSAVRKIVLQGSAKLSETQDKPRETMMGLDERIELARHAQRVLFEHIADRVHIVLRSVPSDLESTKRNDRAYPQESKDENLNITHELVVSGGVASNKFFRHVLHRFFESRKINVKLTFPPVSLCTDNALMIAWAGMEMWEAGWRSDLNCTSENRWPLAGDHGLMGIGGWHRHH